jgi:cytochrome c
MPATSQTADVAVFFKEEKLQWYSMKKSSLSILSLFIICLFLLSAGCIQGQPAHPAAPPAAAAESSMKTYTANETLVAFVKSAISYAKVHGTEKALVEFSNRNGSFIQGELYIFAYGFNGTTLAHPINPEAIGKPREGANAIFVKEMGAAIRNGSGFFHYEYINPRNNNTLESKMGYGEEVADDWWLGSGVYTGPVTVAGKSGENVPGTVAITAPQTQ